MKKFNFLCTIVLLVCLISSYASATKTWVGPGGYPPLVGYWNDPTMWSPPGVPDGTDNVDIPGSISNPGSTCILNTMEVWVSPNKMRVYGDVTLFITDGCLVGPSWLRVGEKSIVGVSYVNQIGGRVELLNGGLDSARLTLSDGNGGGVVCDGYYNISGGTLTYDKVSANTGQITVGDRQGKGILYVIGTGGTIDMGALEMGGRIDKTGRASDGTLEFEIESDGVSPVQVTSCAKYAGSTTHLLTQLTEPLDDPYAVIFLVINSGINATPVIFDDWNGGSAEEGAVKDIGLGVVCTLTYQFDADGDGANNDIALLPGGVIEPESDLGDAPDSTNTMGPAMTTYPAGTVANFPTVYAIGSPPFGPIHWQPTAVAWLGNNVTLENEADIGTDQDPNNNIIPALDIPDMDLADDGVMNMPLVLPHCRLTTFQYQINVVNPNIGLYVNVWFDWNRDGDWDDTATCTANNAPEWAIQNQFFAAGSLPAGLNTVTSPQFRPWHPTGASQIWMRITLSEQPWTNAGGIVGDGGCGPAAGYAFGETEDYYFTPITECLKPTALEYTDWVAWGRPNCWCCQRQCKGDINCLKTGPFWVQSLDLAVFRSAFNLTNPLLALVPDGICADLDHKQVGPFRVQVADLTILRLWFNLMVVPCCDLDGDCILTAADKYNFWTN